MKKSRFTESQIVSILKESAAGKTGKDLCREHGVSEATFYKWKKKYGGMGTPQLRKLRDLEDENRKLKRMYADLSLDHFLLKEVLEKKF